MDEHGTAPLGSATTRRNAHTKTPRHKEEQEEHLSDFVALWLCVRTSLDLVSRRDAETQGE
jgi:hypothetical protein